MSGQMNTITRLSRYWRLALLAILLLAAFLRFWRLDSLPPGLYHDEAYNGLDALSLLQGKVFPQFYEGWELYAADAHAVNPPLETRYPIFFEGNYGREPLHVYLMALSISLLGATPLAVRAAPAAAGVLAVLTTFFAARALINDPQQNRNQQILVPLLAAFFLAILYPALHFSRFGIRAMVFAPVETLAVACFWLGVNASDAQAEVGASEERKRRRRVWMWFLLAGVFLGLGIYTFAAARLLPLVWVLFIPLWFWIERGALRRFWKPAVAMTGMALLTALPILLFFWQYPYYFVFRIAYVANRGKGAVADKAWLTWLLNVGRVLRGFFWQGETHLRHNLPGRPYLDPIQAVFFIVGLAATLRKIVRPRSLFLLIWLGVMLLPSILSGDAPHFGRLTGAAAPAAILMSLGVVWTFETIRGEKLALSRRARRILTGFLCLTLGVSAFLTARDYFGRYANHPDLARDFYLPDWELGQAAAALPPEASLYLTPAQEELATIYFALQDPERLRDYNGAAGAVPAGIPGQPATYFVRPGDRKSLHNLENYFAQGESGAGGNGFVPFEVTAVTARDQSNQPLNHNFDTQIKLLGYTLKRDNGALDVVLTWQALAPIDRDYTAFVHLLDADGQLLTQLDRPPAGYPTSDWQPGEIVVDTYIIQLPDQLPAGVKVQTGFYYLPTLERLGETAVFDLN